MSDVDTAEVMMTDVSRVRTAERVGGQPASCHDPSSLVICGVGGNASSSFCT